MIYENKKFVQIKNFPEYFICKETSEVLSIKQRKNTYKNTYKILKQVPNSKDSSCNYFIVTLVDNNGKHCNKFIHRLMAETFIPNPMNKTQINHIDGNKQNNNINNLEWVTPQENSQHAVKLGLSNSNTCKKAVKQFDKNGNFIARFSSLIEAYNKTGIQNQNISKVLRGLRSYAGGYKWMYDK